MPDDGPYLFISYRRVDTQWVARQLYQYFAQRFGSSRVFMDRVEIRLGDNWRSKIDVALRNATSIIALIGPQWLSVTDEKGRRRLEAENDWVHTEIRTAINYDKHLLPLYVDGAKLIEDPQLLPEDIWRLPERQAIALRQDDWYSDLGKVVRALEAKGFRANNPNFPMPEPRKRVDPLSRQQLETAL
jgi:hypothetical protein